MMVLCHLVPVLYLLEILFSVLLETYGYDTILNFYSKSYVSFSI